MPELEVDIDDETLELLEREGLVRIVYHLTEKGVFAVRKYMEELAEEHE